jgi:hypothetical protein
MTFGWRQFVPGGFDSDRWRFHTGRCPTGQEW